MKRFIIALIFIFWASICSSQTVVFSDGFTNGSNGDNLTTVTPDTAGTSWIQLFNDTSETLTKVTGDLGRISANDLNVGIIYQANYGASVETDMDIEIDINKGDNGADDTLWVIFRWQDINNFGAFWIHQDSADATKLQFHKVVSGTHTALGTPEDTAGTGDVVTVKLRGDDWTVFKNSVEITGLAETVTDLSSAGKTGWGLGAIHSDYSGHDCDVNWEINSFKITEYAASSNNVPSQIY